MRLTLKLPAAVVGAIVLTAVSSGTVSGLLGRSVLRQAALDESVHSVEAYRSAMEYQLETAFSLLDTTARLSKLDTIVSAREAAVQLLAGSRVFEYVMLVTPGGRVAMLEPRTLEEKLPDRDVSFSAWYAELLQTNHTVLSDLHISPVTLQPSVVIASPMNAPDGQLTGIWLGALKLHAITQLGLVRSGGPAVSGWGYVTDRRGLIVAHQANPEYVKNQTDFSAVPAVVLALAGKGGAGEFFNAVENVASLAAYRPLGGMGWAVVYGVPTTIALAPLDTLLKAIALTTVALAALIAAGMLFYTRRMVAPLKRLAVAARTVGMGESERPIGPPNADEIGQLDDAFHRMTAAIAQKDAAAKSRLADLGRSNAELEQFAYVASHDLQEPLRMVVGYVQLLEGRLADKLDAETRGFMGYAVDGALRMQTLIEDILAYSRVRTQGQLLAPVDSAAALKSALELLATAIFEKQAEVSAGSLPIVIADETQLVQLFQNLIGNAIKFCKDRAPRVHVGAVREAGMWKFSVTDNGIGIAPEYRGRLFAIFKRLHTRREYPGTGIGLAICKRIVERHGGEIGIEAAPDGGSIFWFTLPGERPL